MPSMFSAQNADFSETSIRNRHFDPKSGALGIAESEFNMSKVFILLEQRETHDNTDEFRGVFASLESAKEQFAKRYEWTKVTPTWRDDEYGGSSLSREVKLGRYVIRQYDVY